MNEKVARIYGVYNNHEKGYIVTIEDYLVWLSNNGFTWAIGSSGTIMGNKQEEGTYFEISGIELGKTIEEQKEYVIEQLYNKIITN